MKLTQEQWQQLKEKFGTHAYERVQYVEKGDLGQAVYYSHNNNDVDKRFFICYYLNVGDDMPECRLTAAIGANF